MNLAQHLVDSARKHPDKTACRHGDGEISFRELDEMTNRFAGALNDLGLAPGDRCLVMMPNSIEQIAVYYALAKMGVVQVLANFMYRGHELEHIIADSQPKAFIGAEPYLDEVRKIFAKTGMPPIALAKNASGDSGFADLAQLSDGDRNFTMYPADDDDILNILYTSGTTGVSKGAMLTHKNLVSNCRTLAMMRGNIESDTVVIGVLPLYHVFGINSVLNTSICLGLTILMLPQFNPEQVTDIIEQEERTILFAVPTMYNRLIQTAEAKPPKRSSLKFAVSGGASLPEEFLHRFETLFHAKIYEGYGLTEAPVCIENPYNKTTKIGSIGVPIPGFAARVVDADGNDLPPGESGELLVKGPAVMKGYLNCPDETAEAITDGWLHTGDIARADDDGYFYIVDRKKDLIIRGGYNVYPREIEEVIYQLPEVLETAVVGLPHQDLGEEIAAFIVLKEGAKIDSETIKLYVKERVAPYKYPRIITICDQPLPKSGSGKILKKELRNFS